MRAAAIDYGTVRLGIAVADELGLMAHPRPHILARDLKQALIELLQLADSENITHFVVGLPRHLDGREGGSARRARHFAKLLETKTGRSVEMMDEWLTTREAQTRLHEGGLDTKRSRGKIDSAAAAILLQAWLDARPAEER